MCSGAWPTAHCARSNPSLVKKHAAAAGLDAAQFSGHSLRAGLVTSAARAGVPERVIMRQTGQRSLEMVLKYVRAASALTRLH